MATVWHYCVGSQEIRERKRFYFDIDCVTKVFFQRKGTSLHFCSNLKD